MIDSDVTAPPQAGPGPRTTPRRRGRDDLRWLGAVTIVVALAAQLPVLRTRTFYFWDDSASYFLPTWHLIGERLRAGTFSLLDADMWVGGNWVAEGQLGIGNPLVLANSVLVSFLPDLAVAALVVKTEFLVILAGGVYLLAREYGAGPAASAAVAVALPFSGYTLYWDAQNWPASILGFIFLPHLWWTCRRFARGRLHPVVPLIVGYLAITSGSPYGALGVIVVLAAVAFERLVLRDWRSVVRLGIVGASIGLAGAIVFLPLLGIQPIGYRTRTGVENTGFLRPELGQLLNLSSPSYVAPVRSWGPPSTPMTYLAWFVVPLLPWFAWSSLRRARPLTGLFLFGGVYLLLALGPSNAWLFRWPARLIEYVFLPVCVLVALLLTPGLRTNHGHDAASAAKSTSPVRARAVGSAALIGLGTYLAWANAPLRPGRHIAAGIAVAVLVLLVLLAARRRPPLVVPVLMAGTVVVLALQLRWFPGNVTVTPWRFPSGVAGLRADFAGRSDGNTITVANPAALPPADRGPDGAWREILFGNMNHVAGLASVNAYSGMGNRAFAEALCMDHVGATCSGLYDRLFRPSADGAPVLADRLRLQTVVVLNGYLPGGTSVTTPPSGWQITDRTERTTTLRRVPPLPYPDGRLSWAGPTVAVRTDHASGAEEEIRYRGGGRIGLAAIAWPGWRATVDGQEVPVHVGRAGLIEVDLPQRDAEAVLRLSFRPAGLDAGLALLGVGVLLGGGYSVYWSARRRAVRGSP